MEHKRTAQKLPEQAERSKLRWGVFSIILAIFLLGAYIAPSFANPTIRAINSATGIGLPIIPEESFSLGLDLQGGAQLIYEADVTSIAEGEKTSAVEGVRDVIERRVNALGVGEPNVQTARDGNTYRLVVDLPGVTDINDAIERIGETPTLEFKELSDEPARELTDEEQAQMEEFNNEARAQADAALAALAQGRDFADVAAEFSTDEQTRNNGGQVTEFVNESNLAPEITDFLAQAQDGDYMTDAIELDGGFLIIQKNAEQAGPVQTRASHILLCYLGASGCDNPQYTKDEALNKAREIFDQATADNFESLAREFSTDPSVAENGGDLGFFSEGTMVDAFYSAIAPIEPGNIVGPVETEFGYHVIFKTDEQPSTDYQLSQVAIAKLQPIDILGPQDPWESTPLGGQQLERAEVVSDPTTGEVQVSLLFDAQGADLFEDITRRNIGQQVAIFLDGEIISAPVVNQAIPSGRAVISGNFSLDEARLLAQRLNAGALPVPVSLQSQQTIGATLGTASLMMSLRAGMIALALVLLFMIAYYRLPGVLAVIALALYLTTTLAIFKLIGVTLSLSGIAGIILSIGMAVDANILIFERVKEELQAGRTLKQAVSEGFIRAWSSIRDGNVSTILTALLLMTFGSSFVRGFAITLVIGVLVSMITAIAVTKVLLQFVIRWFDNKGHWLFLGSKKRS